MELRYYVMTAISVIVLQFLLWNFSRTFAWLFNLSAKSRKTVAIVSYLGINSLMLLNITRLFFIPRMMTLILALLLFAFFIRVGTLAIYWLAKRWVNPKILTRTLKIGYPLAFVGLIGLSLYNAYVPMVTRYSITLDKPLDTLRIGVVSDLHLGKLFGAKQLDKLAEIFQQEKVDLILMPGDIMDDNTLAYEAEKMHDSLSKIRAPLGVYATLGNHDFFGEQYAIMKAIEQAGIQVLWDQALVLDGKFAIIGRNDELLKTRPATETLLQNVDTRLPIFLLDHRPSEIEQHAKLPIDLQVSGHTHNGQIFPAQIMTKMMYRLDYGYEKIGNGHFVVTSGYGFWGIPMRLGSQSEVVIIEVKGK